VRIASAHRAHLISERQASSSASQAARIFRGIRRPRRTASALKYLARRRESVMLAAPGGGIACVSSS